MCILIFYNCNKDIYVEHISIFCNNEYNVELHFNMYNILLINFKSQSMSEDAYIPPF